jgi:hypothetical protein
MKRQAPSGSNAAAVGVSLPTSARTGSHTNDRESTPRRRNTLACLYCPEHVESLRSRMDAVRWPKPDAPKAYAYLIVGLIRPDDGPFSCDACRVPLGPHSSAGLLVSPTEHHLDEPFETYYFDRIRGLELYGPVPEPRRLQLWRQLEPRR